MKGFYIHENAMDVFIQVQRTQYQDQRRLKLKVHWWNLGFTGKPWVISLNNNIEILHKDLHKWRWFNPDVDSENIRREKMAIYEDGLK